MAVTEHDIRRMQDALFIERGWRSPSASRFWVLLVLSAVIATSGIIADSTATVIGAMIVAPLMTPILGIALATALGDRTHLLRSIALVTVGAAIVVAIAFLISSIGLQLDDYSTNTQVSGRISPRLIDLLAALATGMVGAFALVRRDISDTLPGVAIAISLVPPLAVVGVLLGVQRYGDAAQALLLFLTNVAAIIATGTIVLTRYKVRSVARAEGLDPGGLGWRTKLTVGALVLFVSIPLTIGTLLVAYDHLLQRATTPLAQEWAAKNGWQIATVQVVNRQVIVTALGPPPEINPEELRKELNDEGFIFSDLVIRLVVGGTRTCPAYETTCYAGGITDQ